MTTNNNILDNIRGGLVVSCQSSPPLSGPQFAAPIAQSAVIGGAVGIRVNGAADVAAVRAVVDVPIIGINKQRSDDYPVYITPTVAAALAVVAAGADIVALDGSTNARPNGEQVEDIIAAVHAEGKLVMADISTLEEGVKAEAFGADIVASTLSGYTPYSPKTDGPDLALIAALTDAVDVPVIAEGRYYTPADVAAAFERGAFAVVVGRAITEPQLLTQRFAAATPRGGNA